MLRIISKTIDMGLFNSRVSINESEGINLLKEKSTHLSGFNDLNVLFDKIGTSRIVMLGEASHGTHEYYTWRSYITKKLIKEKNFSFIAVEGDWPDCYNINCYIKGTNTSAKHITDILKTFDRWPTWMWANWEIAALGEWLHSYNKDAPQKAGFYGLDVYSLWESLDAIRSYLEKNDPEGLKEATKTFKCFEPYKEDETSYAYATRLVPDLCEDEVVALLTGIQKRLPQNESTEESIFSAEQNALIAVNAEKYYRAMIRSNADSWNIRDEHMQETLERLLDHHGPESKAIIWAHNTHVGDASATDMAEEGMFNLGELARERFPGECFVIGFGSYEGSVIAGKAWGAPIQSIQMPEARKGSLENLLHKAGPQNKLLLTDSLKDTVFEEQRIDHRAIGVVYKPEHERYGNYVPTNLPARYDAFIYLDKTMALHPLDIRSNKLIMPETYPFGT